MKLTKLLSVILFFIITGSLAWLYAQVNTVDLSPQDLYEIEQVVQGYHRGIDIGPEDASWVFSEDAVFEYSAGNVIGAKVSGKDALKEFYANLRKTNTSRHLVSNLVITPTKDGASGSLYMTTLDKTEDSPVAVTGFGIYEDEYIKTEIGWRIKKRVYSQQMPPVTTQ